MKKLISIVLSLAMLTAFFSVPITVNAAEKMYCTSGTFSIDQEKFIEDSGDYTVLVDSDAVKTVRDYLRNHETVFDIGSTTPKTIFSITVPIDDITDKKKCEEYIHSLFFRAVEHTGEPTEGDYILRQIKGYNCKFITYQSGGQCYIDIDYEVSFFTTREDEDVLNKKINSILNSLDLNGKTEYQKIKAIYDYLCENVEYDYTGSTITIPSNGTLYLPYEHSAYGALCNNIAVCQGYAVAFYRLALEAGIDSRVIVGKSSGGDHAWNIVKLKGKYYLLDSTWDANASDYEYFLKCEKDFPDHYSGDEFTSSSFKSKYPISDSSYYDESEELSVFDTIGDIDGDNRITSLDSLFVLRASVNLETTNSVTFKLSDIDEDGKINSLDALEILRFSVKLPANKNIGKKIR